MPLLPKKLHSIFKPKNKSTLSQGTNDEEDYSKAIDIICLLWKRNMVLIVRHIFVLAIQPGQVATCRQVCKLWNEIIKLEILPHLEHVKIAHNWFHGQIQVTDLEYLKNLDASNEKVTVYQIVPLERFTFILLTRNEAEHVLMVYELEQFKACVNLPLLGVTIDRTLIKLNKNTVNIISDRSFDYLDFLVIIISLDDYQIICDNLVINSTCTSLHHMRKMQELMWSNIRHDGSMDINVLTDKEPFHEIVQTIPGAKNFARPDEMIISRIDNTFHHEITMSTKPTHMVMKTYTNRNFTECVRLVNLLSGKVEFESDKQYSPRYFLTDQYFIYANWNKLDIITSITIKRLSDGVKKKVKLPSPERKHLLDCPVWNSYMNLSICEILPGSNVAMLCYEKNRGHAIDVISVSIGFATYFVDLKRGVLIGGEDGGLFVYTDPLAAFKMLTPSMFLVAASGFGRQRCFMFRMSDNKEVHRSCRDVTQDVAEAIGGLARGFLRVHIEHRDPRSSPKACGGNDHLIFSLEDSECPLNWDPEEKMKGVSYSKILFVKFC